MNKTKYITSYKCVYCGYENKTKIPTNVNYQYECRNCEVCRTHHFVDTETGIASYTTKEVRA